MSRYIARSYLSGLRPAVIVRGSTIRCPARALWAGDGALPRFYPDPLEPWRVYAPAITGRGIDGASHFLVEDAAQDVAGDLLTFFASA